MLERIDDRDQQQKRLIFTLGETDLMAQKKKKKSQNFEVQKARWKISSKSQDQVGCSILCLCGD